MRTPSHLLSHCVILERPLDIFYILKGYKTYVLATFVIQGEVPDFLWSWKAAEI